MALGEIKEHQKQCERRLVTCPGVAYGLMCGEKIPFSDLAARCKTCLLRISSQDHGPLVLFISKTELANLRQILLHTHAPRGA